MDMAGGPQLRNIGTIGGNVCNGVTSADSASSLCCLDADLVLKGPDGVREVPIWKTVILPFLLAISAFMS